MVEANIMVTRTVLLMLFFSARLIAWIVEQPASSLMWWHPRMQYLQRIAGELPDLTGFHKTSFPMDAYGADTQKPTTLCSSEPWVHNMATPLPKSFKPNKDKQVVNKSVNAVGHMQINGGKDLKGTQAYPDAYGRKVLSEWKRARIDERVVGMAEVDDDSVCSDAFEEDPWEDAQMGSLCAGLGAASGRIEGCRAVAL